MKKSTLFSLFVLLFLLTACSPQPAEPEDYIGIEAAKAAALTDAGLPAGAAADFSAAGLDREDGQEFYAVDFTIDGASYQYQIHPVTGQVLRSSSQGPRLIGEEAAREIALQHAGLTAEQVTFLPTDLEIEDGRQVYDVEFYTAGYTEYDYEIDAVTGEVVSLDYDTEHSLPSSGTVPGAGENLSLEEAKAAALTRAGLAGEDVTFTEVELDREDGRDLYQFAFRTADGTEYECDVVALTGEVVEFECDREHAIGPTDPSRPLISHEEAKAIALNQVPGATAAHITDFQGDYDGDDGRLEYEVEIRYSGMEYEIEIDSASGAILKYEAEPID